MDLVVAPPPVAEVEIPATLGQLDEKVGRGRKWEAVTFIH